MNDYEASLPLGKSTAYVSEYGPPLLCPLPRQVKRDVIGVTSDLPLAVMISGTLLKFPG